MPPTIVHDERGPSNRRFVLGLDDGASVEAVLYRDETVCLSSQVGCAVRCPFCASGAHGLARSLTTDEIVGQLEAVEALLSAEGRPAPRGVTLSGIGEPLHAWDAAQGALAHAAARGLRATVTTSGGPTTRLATLLADLPHQGVTVSIHAGTEPTRARLVPHGPDLAALFATLSAVLPTLSRKRRKRVALAYLLLEGQNDADEEVDAFVARAAPLGVFVHLYAHNPVPESAVRGPVRARYDAVHARMVDAGLIVRRSAAARREPNGGCGTLVALRRSAGG